MNNILLEVNGISKHFGATQALKDVSVSIRKGTIHSFLGRNGAGKSTLVNIIGGIYKQDSGSVIFNGESITSLSVFDRQNIGIRMVPQHASIIPELSVQENIFMGLWPLSKTGFVDWKKLKSSAIKELENYGLNINPNESVKNLSNVNKRKVNIVRAMYGGAKLVILDEPTTSLTSEERFDLFNFVRRLKEQGTAFIFISHYLNEAIELSDEITVIRDGMAFQAPTGAEASEKLLSNLIAGEDVELLKRTKPESQQNNTNLVLECTDVCSSTLHNVSFNILSGEIVGIVGLPGSGAQEICRTLFGLEKMTAGTVKITGDKPNISTPSSAMRSGISYLPGDRHKEGFIPQMNILDNLSIPLMYTKLTTPLGIIDKNKAIDNARQYFDLLHVKANSIYDKLSSLSGGNQQKVVVGKSLCSNPKLLILDEPTIGIDIKSREEIITIVNEMANGQGMSVMYLTNDFDELVRITDRIIFFHEGYLVGDIANINLSHDEIVRFRDSSASPKKRKEIGN